MKFINLNKLERAIDSLYNKIKSIFATKAELEENISSHTHNYAGAYSPGGPAKDISLIRYTGKESTANYMPAGNSVEIREYGNDCSDTPSADWYHIYTAQSGDLMYASQLAVGMTTTGLQFRNRHNDEWKGWQKVSTEGHTHDFLTAVNKTLQIKSDGKLYYADNEVLNSSNFSAWAAPVSHGRHIPNDCVLVSNWNDAVTNGWYMGSNSANAPLANKWYMGYALVHNSNYVVQQVCDFAGGGTELTDCGWYERIRYNGTWSGWVPVYKYTGGKGRYWNKNVSVGGDGVVEVGKYMDWHFTHSSQEDYDVRFQMTDNRTVECTGTFGAPSMKIGGNRVYVSSGTPSSPATGTVWIQI